MTTTKDQTLIDVFTTACEGGINYWANVYKYHWTTGIEPDYEGFEAKVLEGDGGDITKEGRWLVINRETVENGIDELAKRLVGNDLTLSAYHAKAIIELWMIVNVVGANDDNLDYDADTADLIVQQGLFGDVIYG